MNWRAQGFRAWLWQRATAVYMAFFVVFFALAVLIKQPDSYAVWRSWVGDGRVASAIALFFLALLVHSWVGIRDVVIDYVRSTGLRLGLLALVGLLLGGTAMWVLRVLFLATL